MRLLDRIASGNGGNGPNSVLEKQSRLLQTGSMLVREWDGARQRVVVLDKGFAWNGKTYRSLSAVAFAMTGTRWTGVNEKLGFRNPEDLRAAYPSFFWKAVKPYIGNALNYLRVTQEGKLWIANLYAHVFSEEHRGAIGVY